jgi:hypothetical protein
MVICSRVDSCAPWKMIRLYVTSGATEYTLLITTTDRNIGMCVES